MHPSAMVRMNWFVENYVPAEKNVSILDVGSYNVNGCYRDLFKARENVKYVGLDITEGPNVDVVAKEPYDWSNVEDESFDFIISGNAFEHIEYPWLTIRLIIES